MKRKIELFLCGLFLTLGTLASYAQQNITYTGEKIASSRFYFQSVNTGYFLKKPNEMVKYSDNPTLFVYNTKNQSITGLNYRKDAEGSYNLIDEEDAPVANSLKPKPVSNYVYVFSKQDGKYYHLNSSKGSTNATMVSRDTLDIATTDVKWKLVSEKQFNTFDPNKIAEALSAHLGCQLSVKWVNSFSTVLNGDDWFATATGSQGKYLNLQIKGFPKGKYSVDFYGKASRGGTFAQAVVKYLDDDTPMSTYTEPLSTDLKHYIIPIEVVNDDGTLDIYVNTKTYKQTITAVVKSITKIDDDQFKALQTRWTPEIPSSTGGDYYLYNPEALSYLTASETNNPATSKIITKALPFHITGTDATYLTYKNGASTYYVSTETPWKTGVKTTNQWNLESAGASYGVNAYSIKKNDASNLIDCNGSNDVSFTSTTVSAKSIWNFISQDQYDAVYPQERIRKMLGQNVTVERDFSYEFSTAQNKSLWYVKQEKSDVNNEYTITGLSNGTYVVELLASKEDADREAKVYANTSSQVITKTLETYTLTVNVTDGKMVIYEDAPDGAGNLSLAIKNITTEENYKNNQYKLFKGETLADKTSYFINNIGGNTYLTGISTNKVDISNAVSYAFTASGTKWKIANGTDAIGYNNNSLSNDYSAWTPYYIGTTDALGVYYEMYEGSYYYWINNNGNLSLTYNKSKKNLGSNYHFRFISKDQYDALFPQNKLRTALYNYNLEVLRDGIDGLEMSQDADSKVWMVKQHTSGNGNYQKIIINNLSNDGYILTLCGKVDGDENAVIRAQIGSDVLDLGQLTSEYKSFDTEKITVKGGTIILYVYASSSINNVYFAVSNIKSASEQVSEDNTSKITWTNETAAAGKFRLYHPATKTFLNTPGFDGSILNGSNSKIFTFQNGSSSTIQYDENGETKYVCHTTGDGDWGTSPMTWTISSKNDGYTIVNDNRYIQYNKTDHMRYPTPGGLFGFGKSSTWSNNDNDRVWQFLSESQYDAVAPTAIAQKYASLGTGVTAKWETDINTSLLDGIWTAVSNASDTGEYNKITISGLDEGYYDVQMLVRSTNMAVKATAVGRTTATRTVYQGTSYIYSLPVHVTEGVLTIYVATTGNAGNVYSAIKDIKRIGNDNGVVDTYIKNAYFALPQGTRNWNYKWYSSFEAAANESLSYFEGNGIHAEITGKMEHHQKTYKIYQKVSLASGHYVLSADVVTQGRLGHLYAKVTGGDTYDLCCYGEPSRYSFEFDVPSSDEYTTVEIGFYSDTNGYNDPQNNNAWIGIDWTNQFLVAVDNFRLSYSDDYLKNPDFTDGLKNWQSKTLNITSNSSQFSGKCVNVSTNNGVIAAGYVQQEVTLPAGAYTLSAHVSMPFGIGHLFAKIGDREQKNTISSLGWEKKNHFFDFTFVVTKESKVTVGYKYDELTTELSNGSGTHIALDNFQLVRIGDAGGTDVSSQIVNNDFSLGKDNAGNKRYGWEQTEPGFSAYNNNAAEVYYNSGGGYDKWASYIIKQTVSGLPDGWYKIEAQGFYRDGSYVSAQNNKLRAMVFANESSATVKSITDIDTETSSGSYPNSMWDAAQAFENNPDKYMNVLTVHVVGGDIELGVKREANADIDWTIFNYFKLYYMYEEDVFADVSSFIKNPSFETGTKLNWVTNYSGAPIEAASANSGDGWDGSYYYAVTTTSSTEQTIVQTVSGIPAGVYEVSALVQSVGDAVVNLYGYTVSSSDHKIGEHSSTSVEVVKGTVEIKDGEELTIGVGSLGKFNVDKFTIKKVSAEVYLYNVEAGSFYGKQFNTGYDVIDIADTDYRYPVGLSTDGELLVMTKNDDDIATFKNASTDEYINARQVADDEHEYKYTFYNVKKSHANFKVENIASSNFCYLSVDPSDLKFGVNAYVENIGMAGTYIGKYGVTYMGWSGEAGFDVVLPVIPSAEIIDKGAKWQILTPAQYETYKDVVAAAHSTRMAVWPLLCSARRSKLSVDYSQFESVYYSIASTAEQIQKRANDVKDQMLSESLLNSATEQSYVDLSFLVPDANCSEKDAASWTSDGADIFASCEISGQTATKIFSGRHYEAYDPDNKLANTEFYYVLSGLPSGRYKAVLTTSAYADGKAVSGAVAFVRNNFGDTEVKLGAKLYSIKDVSTPKFSIDANNPNPTIGIKLKDTNAKLVSFDNIRIYYLGKINSDVYNYGYESENGVLKLLGEWPNDTEAKDYMSYVLGSNASVCTIYLKDPDFTSQFDVNIDGTNFNNKNLLIYRKSSGQEFLKVSNVNNEVFGTTCNNYVITDKNDISIPERFTAKKVSYSRAVSSKYGTLCLPFSYKSDENIEFFNFGGFIQEEGVFRVAMNPIGESEEIAACTPCIFKKLSDTATSITISKNSDTEIYEYEPINVEIDGYSLVGAFKAEKFTDPAQKVQGTDNYRPAASDCYYIAKDKFWRGNDYFTNNAFRAYIYAGSNRIDEQVMNARSISLFEVDYNNSDGNATSVEEINEDKTIVGYYNVKGQAVDNPTSGIVFVKYSDGSIRKVVLK